MSTLIASSMPELDLRKDAEIVKRPGLQPNKLATESLARANLTIR
jgi:hypothetical protein